MVAAWKRSQAILHTSQDVQLVLTSVMVLISMMNATALLLIKKHMPITPSFYRCWFVSEPLVASNTHTHTLGAGVWVAATI